MAQVKTQERPSLRVDKRSGEAAIEALRQLDVLDRQYKPRLDGQVLVLPLVRQLGAEEIDSLRNLVGKAQVGLDQLDRRRKNSLGLEEVLSSELSPSLLASLPSSFDIIGDIAVLEFPPELSTSEKVVGEGILKVHKNVRSVFAKAGAVSGVDRVRPLRHIAGEDRTVTVHREFGCRFQVDLAKTYFSPRLSNEHQRVSSMVQSGEVVLDMFAGVGPFSILIARRIVDVEVHAVDSNPEAARLLRENVRINRLEGKVKVWEGDVREVVDKHLQRTAARVIMNLPSNAREFVDVACKALRERGGVLHYYTFAEGLDHKERSVSELEHALGAQSWSIREKPTARSVRGVAPMQWQVAVDAKVGPQG